MTAYVTRNRTEEIAFISTSADKALTDWAVKLGREYISIPTQVYQLHPYVDPFPFCFDEEADQTVVLGLTTCHSPNLVTRLRSPRRGTPWLASLIHMFTA